LSAAFFQQTKLSHRTARAVAGVLQFALPIAMFVHAGLFMRMTNISETIGVLFVCGALAFFSWFAASLLKLGESS
jgi:hypothetical protein